MEFPYREIHGFEDAQGNFEYLAGVLNQPQGLALSLLQLFSAQNLVLDSNNRAFYSVAAPGLPANSQAQASFTTLKASWSTAIPLGVLNVAGAGSSLTWQQWGFTAPNTFALNFNNPTATAQPAATWYGVVLGS